MSEKRLTESEYRATVDAGDREQALYDAAEYLVAGLANQSEWWEHLGDAHRDYAALARAAEAQARELTELRERVEAQRRLLELALIYVKDCDALKASIRAALTSEEAK